MSQLAREYILKYIWNQTVFKKVLEKKKIVVNKNLLNLQREIIRSIYLNNNLKKNNLDPSYITGFTDGEGCFLINIRKKKNFKSGYSVGLGFKIVLHIRDYKLLEEIKWFFNDLGHIYIKKDGNVEYVINSIKEIELIINHFDNYSLITRKLEDYKIFKKVPARTSCGAVFIIIKKKEHLTLEGIKKIVSLKSNFNNGLSLNLKEDFSEILQIKKWKRSELIKIEDPNWISGFVDGEGCFFIFIRKENNNISLVFHITQHIDDIDLLKEFINYFKCGYYLQCNKNAGRFIVTKFKDINRIIIPFFKRNSLKGFKLLDFMDFCEVAKLIEKKYHLTHEGIEKIKIIKSNMEKRRKKKYIRQYSTLIKKRNIEVIRDYEEKKFNEWLGGLIDGKGTFVISKKGYANFKLIVSEKDIFLINEIKQKLGGSIKEISGSKALKYKLHNKKSFIKLINKINGLLRNPVKVLQLNRVCILYNIQLKSILPLTYNNGWLSGYFDGNGSIYYDDKSDQINLSITSKNKLILEPLNRLYMGRIKITNDKDSFQYLIYRKKEIINLIDNYFKKYPLKSSKRLKLNLINDFYLYKNQEEKKKEWIELKNKWDKL